MRQPIIMTSVRLLLRKQSTVGQGRTQMVRLSKRMSELDMCSRREADRLIARGDASVLVRGIPIDPVLGQKVFKDETDIVILNDVSTGVIKPNETFDWERIRGDTVILNKPTGWVSSQPRDRHRPAVRLLTRRNFYDGYLDEVSPEESSEVNHTVKNILKFHSHRQNRHSTRRATKAEATLSGYVASGRLDIDSTGLLLFTRNGVVAKKVLSHNVEKEYIVRTKPAISSNNTSDQRSSRDLAVILRGGEYLNGDHRPLLPVVHAEWLSNNELRLILKEGRKRQIRRMCLELLGLQVEKLNRVRVGGVCLGKLPVGSWRLIREEEAHSILSLSS